jgi:thymidine phosphorylase
MLVLSGVADTTENARAKLQKVLDSGVALEKFRENILAQGGDPGICDKPEDLLAKDLKEVPIKITEDGFLESIDTIAVGAAVCAIGGGRMKAEDKVDHAVGYLQEIKIGDEVRVGDTLGILYCRSQNDPDFSCQKIANACKISPSKIETTPLVLEEIGG